MSIKKIAEMTGCSTATVSRVLSDPDHRCTSEELKQRIFQVAREINYIPNEAARNLRVGSIDQNKVYYINILLTRLASEENDPFFNEMLRLVELEIRRNNCIVSSVWHQAGFSNDRYCMAEDMDSIIDEMYDCKEQRSDGLIIIGKCCAKVLKSLKKREKNIVSISRNPTNYEVDEILCDGKKLSMTAIGHLVKCGHSKIGYVGDCHNDARFAGYQSAQIYHNLDFDIDYIFDTTPNEDHGYKAFEYFSKLTVPPTGIYCANDILAIGMLKYMHKHKGQHYVPSIISSDDIAEAQYTTPMLTTVSLPKNEMAHFALHILLDRINGGHKTISKLELEGTLIIRDSCHILEKTNEPEYYI